MGVGWRRGVSPCPAVKMSVNVVGRGVSLCSTRIQVLILKNIPFWGNEHDNPFPHPHSALVVVSGLKNHVATKASGGGWLLH